MPAWTLVKPGTMRVAWTRLAPPLVHGPTTSRERNWTVAGPCILDLELMVESFQNETQTGLYPFNAIRNRALMLAQTEVRVAGGPVAGPGGRALRGRSSPTAPLQSPLTPAVPRTRLAMRGTHPSPHADVQMVLLLDVDFVPSLSFQEELGSKGGYTRLKRLLAQRRVLILPAFETKTGNITTGEELAVSLARGGGEGGKGPWLPAPRPSQLAVDSRLRAARTPHPVTPRRRCALRSWQNRSRGSLQGQENRRFPDVQVQEGAWSHRF